MEPEPLVAHVIDAVGVTHLRCRMTGIYRGAEFANLMAYTRAWYHGDRGWQVVAAHVMNIGRS